jgi:hypothetical protein
LLPKEKDTMNDAPSDRLHCQDGVRESESTAANDAPTLSERRFWRWTAVGLGILAFGKGIREPNAWAYTQAQLDYSAGFMHRGLFGAVLGHPLELNRYEHFAVVSTALLLLLFAALVLLARKSKLAERTPPGELLAVYASSYSVTYLAHLNGYLDIPLALLCLAPLFVRSTGWRLAAAACSTTLGILIHEQFFFAFLPLLIVSILFGMATARTLAQRRLAWVGGILLAALGLGLMMYLVRHGSISAAQADELRQSIARTTDRPLHTEVWKVLPRTSRENLEIMRSVWRRPTYLPAQVESLLLFVPTVAVLSWATLLLLRRWMPGRHRWLYAGVLLATLAPLSLHLLGWDKNRWNELLSLNAFVLLLTVSRLVGGEPVRLPVWLRRACLLVMLLNMATGGGLMGGLHIRPFPFMRSPDAVVVGAPTPGR